MRSLTREWDLMELPTGEVLTTVGTYNGSVARGRLTYVPDIGGAVEIFGRRYRKTSCEVWGVLPRTRQVLALPGESHYEVRAGDIARHYPASPPAVARSEVRELAAALSSVGIPVGVGGSRALDAARPGSDHDLVVYGMENVELAAKTITSLAGYEPCLHFGLDFVRAKYCHFTRLTPHDLELLVCDRWRHFRYRGLAISVDGCDESRLADPWVTAAPRAFDTAHVRGVVLDASQCYVSPKIIDVRTGTEVVRVFTWLNLYAGALRTGDEVAVHGRWIVMHDQQFLRVQDSADAIRVVSRTSTDPV
ncbi:MAG: hypothetical protein GEU94_08710 [Micromonosporaceae bacterium]|nr:hypothetical protein [Micromonosporaceae bacterium]